MEELNGRLLEYQAAVQKRDEYISRLSSSLQSTLQQRDELRETAQHEAQQLAHEITVLREQLRQTSAFLRDKECSGINAAEFVELKNQLIALNANNTSQLEEIGRLKTDLSAKSKALSDAETLTAQLQSTQKQHDEELLGARSQAEADRRRQAELETLLQQMQEQAQKTQFELQQQVRQAQLEKSALEESFTKERAELSSRVDQYTSQLSDQSLLNESLSVTQGRVSELTAQLEAAAHQLSDITGSAARTEAQLRQKIRELEQQLLERPAAAADRQQLSAPPSAAAQEQLQFTSAAQEQLTSELEERFGQQLSQITGELRSSHAAELAALAERHRTELSELRAELESSSPAQSGRDRLLVKSLRTQLATAADQRRTAEQQLARAEAESAGLVSQLAAATEARDALSTQLQAAVDRLTVAGDQRQGQERGSGSDGMAEEVTSLTEQLKTAAAERQELSDQLSASEAERTSLTQQLQTANEETETLRQRLGMVEQVQTDTGAQLTEANQQRDQLCRALAATNQQRDELSHQLDSANQKQEEMSQQLASSNEQLEEFGKQLTLANQQRDELNQQLMSANQKQEEMSQQLASLTEERAGLQDQVRALTDQLSATSSELEEASADRDAARGQLSAVSNQRDQLNAQLTSLNQQQAQLSQQLIEATRQRDQLQANAAAEGAETAEAAAVLERLEEVTAQREAAEEEARKALGQKADLEKQLASVTEKRNDLQREVAKATSLLVDAHTELAKVTGENFSLGEELNVAVKQTIPSLQSELREVKQDLQTVTAGRDSLMQELQGTSQRVDHLTRALEHGAQEVTSARQSLAEVTEERDAARRDREDLQQQLSAHVQQETALTEQLLAATQQRDSLTQRCDSLTQQLAAAGQRESQTSGVVEQWRAELERHAVAAAQLQQALDASHAERDGLRAELETALQERDAVRGELESARREMTEVQSVRQESAGLQSELETAKQERDAVRTQLDGLRAELQSERELRTSSESDLRARLAEVEQDRHRGAEELTRLRADGETALSVLRAQLAAAEAARREADTALAATRAELAELSDREAALRGDRVAAKDASNTAIKLRARVETLTRKHDEMERRAADLEQERAMLQETHQKYVTETTGQLVAAQAEAEKLRACLLIQSVTSPRKERGSVMSPRGVLSPPSGVLSPPSGVLSPPSGRITPRKGSLTPKGNGTISPKTNVMSEEKSEAESLSLLVKEFDASRSPRRDVLAVTVSGREVRAVNSARRTLQYGSESSTTAAAAVAGRVGLSSPRSSASDSGLTAGSAELSDRQLSQLESLVLTGAPSGDSVGASTAAAASERAGDGSDGGQTVMPELPESSAVTRLLRRLSARLAAAQRDKQLLQRRLRQLGDRPAIADRAPSQSETRDGSPGRQRSPGESPVQTARSNLTASPSVSLGVLLTDRTAVTTSPTASPRGSPRHASAPSASAPGSPGRSHAPTPADCAVEAANAVRAALTASERQQAQLLQLEARVSSELAELQLGLKSLVEQGADASAAIVLIDASYEVRLLKSKLSACSSINAALHEQLRVHRRVVSGFQRLFAHIAEEERSTGAPLGEADSPPDTPRSARDGVRSAEESLNASPASGGVRSVTASREEVSLAASPRLREAPASDPRLTEAADSEAWLREAGLTDPELLRLLAADYQSPAADVSAPAEISELRPAPGGLDSPPPPPPPRPSPPPESSHEVSPPEVPPFDLRLLGVTSPSDEDPFANAASDAREREHRTTETAPRPADRSADGGRGSGEALHRDAEVSVSLVDECRHGDIHREGDEVTDVERDADGNGAESEEPLLSDLELLESLVRENGTLRRALVYEKGRGQRLLSSHTELSGRHERAEAALVEADRRQTRLLDCVQRQQETISRLQRAVLEGEPAPAPADLTPLLNECADSLRTRTAAREEKDREDGHDGEKRPSIEAISERLEAAEDDLTRRKLELDEANQLLSLRDRELRRLAANAESMSGECEQLRHANRDLTNRLRRAADTLRRLHALKWTCERRCGRLSAQVARSELVMDLERALWEVESRHQLMEHEQRLYQHFLPSLPATPEQTNTSGGTSPEVCHEVWLFPTGQPPPTPQDTSNRLPPHPATAPGAAAPVTEEAEASTAAGVGRIEGCSDLLTQVEEKLQTEFHSMVQALSVRWTERSLQELRRCRPGQHQDQQDQEQHQDQAGEEQERRQQGQAQAGEEQERRQLLRNVRQLQRWLEDTYREQLQQLHQKLSGHKEQLLKVEAETLEKARSLSQEPHLVIETMRTENGQLRSKLTELRLHQSGLEQRVSEHEQELNSLREYFQEKVKFTENMYSEEIRRLIQQQAGGPELAAVDPVNGDGGGGVGGEELAGLGANFTDLGLPDGADDAAGPSVLRLRVEFERRVATMRQQLEHRVAARCRDVRAELERRHRQEVTELERKHLGKLAQTVERYKRELEAARRESEKQMGDMRSQLLQQHQEDLQRIAAKQRRRQSDDPRDTRGAGDGGGDGNGAGDAGDGGDGSPASDTEDTRRQRMLDELENLSFEMKRQNESEQAAFLEEQRASLERFARQQERAVRQLEARQQAARDEAAQAERELASLRAQSAEAEIRRDQEAARWKLELATGYETQIKAVLAGVTLDEETVAHVSQLRATLQHDSGAALAELESAHQAALRALEARHERQQHELKLQLEAAGRRERHLQDAVMEEIRALRERIAGSGGEGAGADGDGATLELDGLRLHLLQLEHARHKLNGTDWTATESGTTVEVAAEELRMLHRDREEQAEQLQQLGGLVRALCQYYHGAERLLRPPPTAGHSADPEAEATDRMVLEALAPDEGVSLWVERGHQLPRVQRRVREATARLQTASTTAGTDRTAAAAQRESERAERAESRAAELERRADGLAAELTAARRRLAALEADGGGGEEREALGESRPPGQEAPPPPGVTLQCVREAAEALLSTPADPGDARLLLSRVHQLETLLTELTAQSDQMVADCNREVDDVKQQMVAADKQLRSARDFLDEITAERETERDEYSRETARLAGLVAARERERDEQALRRRQLESVEVQNAELLAAAHESDQERAQLREELKAAVDKIHDLRDIIRSLESHVDELGAAGDVGAVERLQQELKRQTAASRRLQTQLSECRCGAGPRRAGSPGPNGPAPPPPPGLNTTADSEDTTLSVCPSLLQEMRDQILRMETELDQRVETLESSFSSAAETLSPAGSRQDLSRQPAADDLGRLRHKLERLASVEEAALARIKHLETELARSRASQQDLSSERAQLQQQLADQLLQLSALRARLERSRLAAEVVSGNGRGGGEQQPAGAMRLAYLQAELDAAGKLIRTKEKQLADLSCELEETRRKLIVRESELARLNREDTPRDPPAHAARDAAELHALRAKHRALQLQHQELMAQLRENNLPEFVERLLSDKNVQIDELEQTVRSLTQLSMRSPSAGDQSSGHVTQSSGHVTVATGMSDELHQPSPEVLRRAATSTHSDPAGDLSRPDISMVYQKEEVSPTLAVRPASSPAAAAVPRPDSPGADSEHSWDSAPTEALGGPSRPGSSVGSELASAAGSSASGDSIHQLKTALARKKQLLNARKQQLERSAQGEQQPREQQQTPRTPSAETRQAAESAPRQPSEADVAEAARVRQQVAQLRGRLQVLDPIVTRLDEDCAAAAAAAASSRSSPQHKKQQGGSETELRLAAQVAEMRRTIEGQEQERRQLEQQLEELDQLGVSETEPGRRQLEERLLIVLRDMEINKLDACSKMHEASALMANSQRHEQQELLSRAQELEQQCLTLEQELHARDSELQDLRARLQSSEQSCGELRDRQRGAEEAERRLTARLGAAEKQVARRDGQLQKAVARLRAAEQQAGERDRRLAEAEQQADEREREAGERKECTQQLQHRLAEVEQQADERVDQLQQRLAEVQQEADATSEREQQLQQKVTSLETALRQRDTRVQQLRERVATLEEASQQREERAQQLAQQLKALQTQPPERDTTSSHRTETEPESDRSAAQWPEPELTRRQERRPASGSSLSELTVAATSELDSSLSATLAFDSSLSATLAEDVPARDPGPGPKTDAMWRERCAALETRCRQLAAGRTREEQRRRQLEARLTALVGPPSPTATATATAAGHQQEPLQQETQEQGPPRRLQTLLDKLHREGVQVLTLSELRYVRSHSPALLPATDGAGAGGDASVSSSSGDAASEPAQTEQQLREKVELLEWRLREERALVDSLQGWLQSEHQTKLRLISGRLDQAEPWPSAAALATQKRHAREEPGAQRQQQQLEAQPAAVSYPASPAPLPPPLPLPASDGSGDGPARSAAVAEDQQLLLLQLRRQLSAEQLQRRRLLAELESERSAAAQTRPQLQRLRAESERLKEQLASANSELQSLRSLLAQKTAELESLRNARKVGTATTTNGGGSGSGRRQMAGLADLNSELDRLRSRVGELERELGQRGDAPSVAGSEDHEDQDQRRSHLDQERVAWSRERQRLQERIAHLTGGGGELQERLRRAGGTGGGGGDELRLQRAESHRRALCWQKRYLLVLLGGYQRTEELTLRRMTQLTGGAFRPDGSRYLSPARKFRAAVWVAVACRRMDFMVNRWRAGPRPAGTGRPASPAPARPLSSASLLSASSCDAHAELDRLGRIVRECPRSVPNVQFDVRSVTSVSDVCTEDLEPYLARFDALLERQGLPPQAGGRADSGR